jgi:non-specific serine/threonine protein kinase
VGKTRLALRVAALERDRTPEGAVFVTLAGLRDPALVIPALTAALGIRHRSDRTASELLEQRLRDQRVLAVLDNFEHLMAAAPELAMLLRRCPGLSILATSRSPLRIAGEVEYQVRPLALPEPEAPGKDPRERALSPAAELFVQRARAVKPDIDATGLDVAAVEEICARLDGLPLALELAAVRVKAVSLPRLAEILVSRLDDLGVGPAELATHQRTIRSTLAWSHDILPPDASVAFRRFAVFAAGATLEAAEAVIAPGDTFATLDLLTTLLDHSLIQRDDRFPGEARYAMLETVREFAQEQLASSGELDQVKERHAQWCRDLAVQVEARVLSKVDVSWLDRLEVDHNNVRAALDWSFSTPAHAPMLGLRIASSLWLFWYYHSYLSEGRRWLTLALDATGRFDSTETSRAMTGLGLLAHAQGDDAEAYGLLDDAIAMARRIGDSWTAAFALSVRGNLSEDHGDYADAAAYFTEANRLFAEHGDQINAGVTTYHLGVVAYGQGDLKTARERCHAAVEVCRRHDCPWSSAIALGCVGMVLTAQDDLGRAADALLEALHYFQQIGSTQQTLEIVRRSAVLAYKANEPEMAIRWLAAASVLGTRIGAAIGLPERDDYERVQRDAGRMLSVWSRAAAWELGVQLAMDDAIAEVSEFLTAIGTRQAA